MEFKPLPRLKILLDYTVIVNFAFRRCCQVQLSLRSSINYPAQHLAKQRIVFIGICLCVYVAA